MGGHQQRLGRTLPSDYKQIVNLYGTGTFNDLFYLFNPFSKVEQHNLMWQAGLTGPGIVPNRRFPT